MLFNFFMLLADLVVFFIFIFLIIIFIINLNFYFKIRKLINFLFLLLVISFLFSSVCFAAEIINLYNVSDLCIEDYKLVVREFYTQGFLNQESVLVTELVRRDRPLTFDYIFVSFFDSPYEALISDPNILDILKISNQDYLCLLNFASELRQTFDVTNTIKLNQFLSYLDNPISKDCALQALDYLRENYPQNVSEHRGIDDYPFFPDLFSGKNIALTSVSVLFWMWMFWPKDLL